MAAHWLRVWLLRAREMAQWGKCEDVRSDTSICLSV